MAFPLLSQRSGSVATLVSLAVATSVMLCSAGGCGRVKSGKAKTGLGGKDVSKAVLGEEKPPGKWEKTTYGIVPGCGGSSFEFPRSLYGALSDGWKSVLNEATAWGTVEYKSGKDDACVLVVHGPTEEWARRAFRVACNDVESPPWWWRVTSRKSLTRANVGDEDVSHDHDDRDYRDTKGIQNGYLVFRRGYTVVYLGFEKALSEDLIEYAQRIDNRVKAVLPSPKSAVVNERPKSPEKPMKWTRGDPEAMRKVAEEAGRAD